MKKLLWLDDVRDPNEDDWLVFSPIEQPFEVIWVKTHQEFVDWITQNGLPDGICFDHDLSDFQAFYAAYPERLEELLAEGKELGKEQEWNEKLANEKTGKDCANWLAEYCFDRQLDLPAWNIQSANPVGKENIKRFLDQVEGILKVTKPYRECVISFWFMNDDHTFTRPKGETLTEIKNNLLSLAKNCPYGMVCAPCIVFPDGKEKRIGESYHVNNGGVDLSKWESDIRLHPAFGVAKLKAE